MIPQMTGTPKGRAKSMNRSMLSVSKTTWVWKNRAPASNFSSKLFFSVERSPSGEVAAPGRRSVAPDRSLPARSLPPFKSVMARMSSGEVRSKTGLVSGWSPMAAGSPERQRTWRIPREDIPMMSDWRARRFLSRRVSWTMGSIPMVLRWSPMAKGHIRITAVWLSVTFMA
jgi:hypothetical protein